MNNREELQAKLEAEIKQEYEKKASGRIRGRKGKNSNMGKKWRESKKGSRQ